MSLHFQLQKNPPGSLQMSVLAIVNKGIKNSHINVEAPLMHLCKHVNTELVHSKGSARCALLCFPGRELEPFTAQPLSDRPGMWNPLWVPVLAARRFRAPQRRPLWTWCSAASAEEEIRTPLIKLFTASVLEVSGGWIMCRRQNLQPWGNSRESHCQTSAQFVKNEHHLQNMNRTFQSQRMGKGVKHGYLVIKKQCRNNYVGLQTVALVKGAVWKTHV